MSSTRNPSPAWKQPPPGRGKLRLTREGWFWLGASLLLLLTGQLKGINLVALLGCLLLALWVLNWLSASRRLRGLEGQRFLEGPVFANTPAPLEVAIHNAGRWGQPGLILEDRGPEPGAAWTIPLLARRTTGRFHREITFCRRGRNAAGPLLVSTTLPLGLMRRSLVLVPEQEIVVLPELGRLHRGQLRRQLIQPGHTFGRTKLRARRHPTAQADLHGLRDFRSGDSPRWIHWRTTARRGELMVREFEEMATDNLILILDPAVKEIKDQESRMENGGPDISVRLAGQECPAHNPRSGLLETAIAMAATICWEWCRQTGDRLVLAVAGAEPVVLAGTTGRDLALRLLECLAVVEEQAPADGQPLVERLVAAELPPAPVLLLSAGPSALESVLTEGLRRPVVCVDVADPLGQDFFEREGTHAP
jgi:uncharacterized protein (DUF58 family)